LTPSPALRDHVGPEVDRRLLVPETHGEGLSTPVLDGPLAPLRSVRAELLTLGFAVGVELCTVDVELPLGKAQSRVIGGKVGEEELEEPRIAEPRRRVGRSIEPRAQRRLARRRDLEDASTSALGLARL